MRTLERGFGFFCLLGNALERHFARRKLQGVAMPIVSASSRLPKSGAAIGWALYGSVCAAFLYAYTISAASSPPPTAPSVPSVLTK